MGKINPRNYIPKGRIECTCKLCYFNRGFNNFCSFFNKIVDTTGCSGFKEMNCNNYPGLKISVVKVVKDE